MRQRVVPDRDSKIASTILDGLALVVRPWLMNLAAQLQLFLKRHDQALRAFEALLSKYPERRGAWTAAGFLYAEKGRFPDAIDAFERALALQADDAATLFNLGFALQRVARHEDALHRLQRAVELQPNLDRAWYGMGLSLIHCGRFAEAIERLKEAARLQPLNPFARYQLAAAYFKLGEHEKVRAEYRRVKGFDPRVAEHSRLDFGVAEDPAEHPH